MKEWKTYKVGDICSSISETYKSKSKSVVLINTSDVLEGRCLNHEFVPNKDLKGQFKKVFKFGDILYSEIRPANKRFAYIDFDATDYIASTKLMVLRNNDKITKRFLYHYLKSDSTIAELQALAESRSGTFPQITFSELSQLEISIPDIETQLAISNFIDTLESKIELNRQINDNLEQQASNLFQDWLNNCENSIMLRELTDNVLDYTPNTHEYVYLLNSSDVTEGQFTVLPLTPNINLKGQFKKRFKKGDILYSEIRPRNRHYAYCYFDADKYIASTRLIVLRAKPEMLTSSILLYQYLMLNNVFEEFTLKTESRSGTFPQGNYEDLSSIKVPYGASQEKIAKALESIYKQLWINLEENERLEALRDSLLPKLMSGELKINEIDC